VKKLAAGKLVLWKHDQKRKEKRQDVTSHLKIQAEKNRGYVLPLAT